MVAKLISNLQVKAGYLFGVTKYDAFIEHW